VLSDRGGVSHDLTTNTLVVTDTLERHGAIEEVLKSVDLPSKQVMIEARIVLADDTFSRDLGARLGFRGSGKSGGTTFGAGTYDSSVTDATTAFGLNAPTANVNLGVPGAPSLGFTIFNSNAAAMLSLELQALEIDNRGKIVSNPRVVTTNLRPAVILQGDADSLPDGQRHAAPRRPRSRTPCCVCWSIPAGVEQRLGHPQCRSHQGCPRRQQVADNVAINAKRIKTQVRVNNGETAVLGGIFEQTRCRSCATIPTRCPSSVIFLNGRSSAIYS
jgi:type IV pilus assembly protein PilQ